MRRRALAVLVLAGAALGAGAPALADPSASQALLRNLLLADTGTSGSVKRLLTTGAGIVDPRSGFVDVTGDGRQDAVALVTTNGAAGTVALYVLSTHGQVAAGDDQGTELKVLFRIQQLHRATVRLSATTVTVVEPRWAPGDDLCCPAGFRERDYGWDGFRFARVAVRLLDADGHVEPPER